MKDYKFKIYLKNRQLMTFDELLKAYDTNIAVDNNGIFLLKGEDFDIVEEKWKKWGAGEGGDGMYT